MINSPLVSIVIPTHNQKISFLRECIESAIKQSYSNIEILISDNHSTNSVPKILNEYQKSDNRIRIVKPERFLSMSESLLFVFTKAKGKYSCYVSSDDILDPDCISELVYKMEENQSITFSHGKARYFEPFKPDVIRWDYFEGKTGLYSLNKEILSRLLDFSYVCFGGCLIRNSIWDQVHKIIDEKKILLGNYLDLVCTIILFQKGDVFYVNKVLVSVRVENENRNSLQSNLVSDALAILNLFKFDNVLFKNMNEFQVNIDDYIEKHYNFFLRATMFEYLNRKISFEGFNISIQKLRLYDVHSINLTSLIVKFCFIFPNLSLKIFSLYKYLKISVRK